ncbi:hypothetical protein Gotur_003517 [Gossypium turneri]
MAGAVGVEASTSTLLVTEMENKMMVEKEGLKSCHEVGNINNQRNREDLKNFMEMGLEPPPNMPQVFKDCIQVLGGTLKQIRSSFLNEDEERMFNAKR